ncbi:MAG: metallophosphoesterase [Ruminococcus sp.]|nr:metallophosphoesterase [Ruminococcus sp.]
MKKIIRLTVAFLIIVILYAWGFTRKTEFYDVKSEKNSLRIVFISDLHNCTYGGKDQSGITGEIDRNKPDLVLFGGDVIHDTVGTENALTLMKYVSEKYLCAYSAGNHEAWRDNVEEFYQDVISMGIPVLNHGESTDFMINNKKVSVYGVQNSDGKVKSINPDDDSYNILLLHQPEQFKEFKESFDLILSGHAHGGQWRLPVILEQGLYAPNQGLFPEYTNGKYEYGNCTHIISRGLARPLSMIFIPRIFNRPEISVIDIYQ